METIEIDARGFTFNALVDGPETGPLLILLHGLAGLNGVRLIVKRKRY